MENRSEEEIKKANSYTYWVDKDKKFYKDGEKPDNTPQLITGNAQLE